MDKKLFNKAKYLDEKLRHLVTQREILTKEGEILSITFECEEHSFPTLNCKYLDNVKTFLLNEINKEIEETQKEFDEL